MDERQEEQFLKRAFEKFENSETLDENFNELILKRVTAKRSLSAFVLRYLKVFIPVLCLIFLGGILLFAFNANEIKSFVGDYLPMLKPWHIFVVFLLVYFHFIRSILILAFVYLRKRFTFASPY